MDVPVSMICPSHGVIWRENPIQIVEQYLKWADAYQENQITILYDTMWDATRRMAEEIAAGIQAVDHSVEIKLFNVAKTDKNDIISEVFKSKIVVAGSSTINKGILSAMAAEIEIIKGLKFNKKKAAAFGSYGWSGESPKIIQEEFKKCGFDVYDESLGVLWVPDEEGRNKCREFGRKLGEWLK